MSIKMNIKQINFVTTWQQPCINRECPICRISVDEPKNIIVGVCGHGFHQTCINSWHQQMHHDKKCPVCNQNWKNKLHTIQNINKTYDNMLYDDGAHSPPFQIQSQENSGWTQIG